MSSKIEEKLSSNKDVTQQLDLKCLIHPTESYCNIYIHPTHNGSVYKCNHCVCKQSLLGNYLIPINQIQNSDSNTVLYNWPFPDDQNVYEKMIDSIEKYQSQKLKANASQYFEQLKLTILAKINEAQSKMESKIQQFFDLGQSIIETYNLYSSKKDLKDILKEQNLEVSEAQRRIHKIIQDTYQNQKGLRTNLLDKIEQFDQIEGSISYNKLNKFQEQILSLISSIEMFEKNPKEILLHNISELLQQNLKIPMDLSPIKQSFAFQTSQENNSEQLQKFQTYFSKIDQEYVREEDQIKLEIGKLNLEDQKEVNNFIQTLIKSKNKLILNQEIQGEIGKNSNLKGLEVAELMELISNRLNYIDKNSKQKLENMLLGIKGYLSCFKFENLHASEKSRVKLEQLNEEKLQEVEFFAQTLINSQLNNEQELLCSKTAEINEITEFVENKLKLVSDNTNNKIRDLLKKVSHFSKGYFILNADKERRQQTQVESKQIKEIVFISQKIHQLLSKPQIGKQNLDELYKIGMQIIKSLNIQPQKLQCNIKELYQLISNSLNMNKSTHIQGLNAQLIGVNNYLLLIEEPVGSQKQNLEILNEQNSLQKVNQLGILNPNNKNEKFQQSVQTIKENLFQLKNDLEIKKEEIVCDVKYENFMRISLLRRVECVPSEKIHKSIQFLQIQRENDSITIKNTETKKQFWRQCYLQNVLNPSKKYIITLELNNTFNSFANFCFGLINQKLKDDQIMINCDNIHYYEQGDFKYIDKVIKGKFVHSNQKQKIGRKKLEFRIHLEQKMIKVSSPPEYLNVAEICDEDYIDLNKQYLFAIMICNPQDSVTILDVEEVSSFDSNMLPISVLKADDESNLQQEVI